MYDKVLKKDEKYTYDWKFNLSRGGKAEKITDKKLTEKLTSLATLVSKELHIGFASIDIIETEDNNLLVLEINSGVMTENYLDQFPEDYNKIKEMYKSAIESLF